MSPKLRRVLLIAACVALGMMLRDPVKYVLWPSDALYKEAGWLSLSEDRSSRIDLLFSFGADPNKLSKERGYAPIHNAAHWGNVLVVRQLAANGANLNLVSAEGDTPLEVACVHAEVAVPVLIELGAKNNFGENKCRLGN